MHIIQTSHIWHLDYQRNCVYIWLSGADCKAIRITPKDENEPVHIAELEAFVMHVLASSGGFVKVSANLNFER
jgi:hypothetical protein